MRTIGAVTRYHPTSPLQPPRPEPLLPARPAGPSRLSLVNEPRGTLGTRRLRQTALSEVGC